MAGSAARGGAAGAAGGLTTVTPGGGTTATAGRCGAAAPAGALATTGVAGGFEAIAGGAGGGVTIRGSCRTGGMILRGSGRAGAAGGCAATTTGGAALAGAWGVAATEGFAGAWLLRAASSSSCFLARIAFSASPGLEICDRSIFGCAVWWARDAPDADVAARLGACPKCERTRSASSPSSELEWVFASVTPTSGRISRIARGFTSSSRARSLIRTLLIRLFSVCATKSPKCS